MLAALRRLPADTRLFLAGMAALTVARVVHTAQVHTVNIDGGYYLEVARHVRDGEGLVSNLSLYHFGYPSFPYPTSVYPLWPLLLGWTARVVPLEAAGHWLPMALSLLAVAAAYGFGRRLWPTPLLPDHVPGLHAGHVLALILAVQGDFVVYSSLPYTEPLAWLLVYLFSWRVAVKGADLSLPWAVETGIWLTLLYFARYQLLVAPIAMGCAYATRAVLGPQRLRVGLHAAVALGIVAVALGLWLMHLRTFVPGADAGALLRFDQNRANDLLSSFDVIVDDMGPVQLLLDRATGLLVAWNYGAEGSYTPGFHTSHWALPFALPVAAWALRGRLQRVGSAGVLAELARPEVAAWWFVAWFGLGSLLSVHAVHKHYNGAWYFGQRQGLMALPAFGWPLVWLLARREIRVRTLGVLLLASTFASGVRTVWSQVTSLPDDLRGDEPYAGIVRWLEERAAAEGGTLVVAFDAANVQRVGWLTEHVGFHWMSNSTSYADVLTMTDRLGADYVILRERATEPGKGWQFLEDSERVERDFRRLPDTPGKHVIFERIR